jgi:excisionase family DNA binding protein
MQGKRLIDSTFEEIETLFERKVSREIQNLMANFQPKQPTEYMTRNEVADMLKIDLSTLHHWTKSGKLKSYGIGNRVYYKRAELEQSMHPMN